MQYSDIDRGDKKGCAYCTLKMLITVFKKFCNMLISSVICLKPDGSQAALLFTLFNLLIYLFII